MDLAEHQPARDGRAQPGSNWSADDDSSAPSAYSGGEAPPQLQHPGDADDVGAFQLVQVSHQNPGLPALAHCSAQRDAREACCRQRATHMAWHTTPLYCANVVWTGVSAPSYVSQAIS